MIGVNARDLAHPRGRPRHVRGGSRRCIPDGVVRVAESGVRGPHDVLEYARAGADAVLVGEAWSPAGTRAGRSPTWSPPARTRAVRHGAGGDRARERRRDAPDGDARPSGPWFGDFGGRFVPEALVAVLDEVADACAKAAARPAASTASWQQLHRTYSGPPEHPHRGAAVRRSTPAARGSLLKREDLNHTGSHKINNVLGQALLAKRMGKTRVIAETGAGQHGVASATAAALMGMTCTVYMGEEDTRRQALNVARMRLLGAEVVPVTHRLAHPQGRHQRGVPRLGRPRRRHPLPVRHRRRARTRSRRWSATSSGSSASRRAPRCSS